MSVEVKANIQKRRQDRLRELQARTAMEEIPRRTEGSSLRPLYLTHGPEGRESERRVPETHSFPSEGLLDGERWGGDPESAWKSRERELLDSYQERRTPIDPSSGSSERYSEAVYPGGPGPAKGGNGVSRRLVGIKLILAAAVFGTVWYMQKSDSPWAQEGRAFVVRSLTEDMDFGTVAAWYDRTFSGAPSLLPAFGSNKKPDATKVDARVTRFIPPVKGKVVTGFTAQKQGVTVETDKNAKVAAMDEGRIVFAGEKEGTGHTLTIQHAAGYRSTYGFLQPTKWETGDWVEAGDLIGTVEGTSGQGKDKLFFSVMKDLQYVNPSDVIPFD